MLRNQPRRAAFLSGIVSFLALIGGAVLPAGAARAQTGNPLHDQLAGMEEPARRAEVFRFITGTGAGCQAIIAMAFSGFDAARTAYWDGRCREGTMYRMALPAQRTGRPRLNLCGATTGGIESGPCFQAVGTAQAMVASGDGRGVTAGPSAAPPAGSRFGAIYATDAPMAAWGFGNGGADRLAVNTQAVRACQTMAGRVPCKFVEEIVNRCGALVQAVSRHPSAVAMTSDISTMVLNRNLTATAQTAQAAEAAALESCRRLPGGSTCRVVATGC
jgi:hypothetical protein